MRLIPISLLQAKTFVAEHHRHTGPPVGWKWGVGLERDGVLIGVGMAGRPVARMLDDGQTLEITRIAVLGDRNANSMLYGALLRAARALGYRRVITYTLTSEQGSSLRAVGLTPVANTKGREWNTKSRQRRAAQEVGYSTEDKVRWEVHWAD